MVDKVSIKILSTCIKMHQLNKEGITRELTLISPVEDEDIYIYLIVVVETLEKKREPIPSMEAIYFLTPSGETY